MRVGWGFSPSLPHASLAPPTVLNAKGNLTRNHRGGDHTKILYFNSQPIPGNSVDLMRQGGHEVLTTHTVAEALAIMRRLSFDALVMDCAEDSVDIASFTAKAHGLQPSLAVFLAEEWGDELASGVEEFTHVLTMLEDDEFARLKVESLMA